MYICCLYGVCLWAYDIINYIVRRVAYIACTTAHASISQATWVVHTSARSDLSEYSARLYWNLYIHTISTHRLRRRNTAVLACTQNDIHWPCACWLNNCSVTQLVMLRVTCISYWCMRLLCISCRRFSFAFLFLFCLHCFSPVLLFKFFFFHSFVIFCTVYLEWFKS